MYERFTDRARKVMQLAKLQACELGQEYIGTEHILLGLAREGQGVAGHVLNFHDMGYSRLRRGMTEMMYVGKPLPLEPVRLPLTPRAKQLVELAIASSRELGDNYVGTEHLLLGLLKQPEGVASEAIRRFCPCMPEELQAYLLQLVGKSLPEPLAVATLSKDKQELLARFDRLAKAHTDVWTQAVEDMRKQLVAFLLEPDSALAS